MLGQGRRECKTVVLAALHHAGERSFHTARWRCGLIADIPRKVWGGRWLLGRGDRGIGCGPADVPVLSYNPI